MQDPISLPRALHSPNQRVDGDQASVAALAPASGAPVHHVVVAVPDIAANQCLELGDTIVWLHEVVHDMQQNVGDELALSRQCGTLSSRPDTVTYQKDNA